MPDLARTASVRISTSDALPEAAYSPIATAAQATVNRQGATPVPAPIQSPVSPPHPRTPRAPNPTGKKPHDPIPYTFQAGDQAPLASAGPSGPTARADHPPQQLSTTPAAGPQTATSNPGAPGNSITSNGQTVTVEQAEVLEDGSTALDLAFTPSATVSNPRLSSQPRRGFTQEEELFRTKWGWAAFAEAQKVASENQP